MEENTKKRRLEVLQRGINSLRCADARMKMKMAQNIVDTINKNNTVTEITPGLLGIEEPVFTKLKTRSKRGKNLTSKKYFHEKAITSSSSKSNITYMDAREILMENYMENQKIPTKRSLMMDFESRSIPCYDDSFVTHLKSRGFVWAKLPYSNKSIIIEDPKRVLERHRYFKKLQEYRDAGRTIVYVEENNFAIQHGMFLDLEPAALSTTKWYLIMATEEGLLKTFTYTFSVTCDYIGGLNDMILPFLPKNSVVVVQEKLNWEKDVPLEIPNEMSSKKDMHLFLEKNGIPFDKRMNKAELILLVNTFNLQSSRRLDVYLKGLGHEVLRRQKGFPNLRFTAAIDKFIKNKYMDRTELVQMTVGTEITEVINGVTEDQWKEMANSLKAEEKKIYEEDLLLDGVIDNLVTIAAESDVSKLDLDDFEHDCGYYIKEAPKVNIIATLVKARANKK